MNILSGSLQPTEGEIYLNGEKVVVPDPITAKKLGIAKIHQELQIVPELSVAENIFLGRWKTSAGPAVDFKAMKDEAKVYLDMLDVHVDPSKKLKDLRIGCLLYTSMQGLVIQGISVGTIVSKALENGLLVISAGSDVLRLVPPLVITKEDIDEMIEKLEKSLA